MTPHKTVSGTRSIYLLPWNYSKRLSTLSEQELIDGFGFPGTYTNENENENVDEELWLRLPKKSCFTLPVPCALRRRQADEHRIWPGKINRNHLLRRKVHQHDRTRRHVDSCSTDLSRH